MKKKLLSALLCLALALTLLPTAALAAPTRLKSVDLVIDLPKAGDPNEMETEVTIKSMKSGNIDLLANGAGILYTEWQGDDVETDDGYAFRAGTTYLVNIKLAFDTTKGYWRQLQNGWRRKYRRPRHLLRHRQRRARHHPHQRPVLSHPAGQPDP